MLIVRCVFVCVCLCALVSPTASAWGPIIHEELAQTYYNDGPVSSLAAEFGTNVSVVVGGAGDLDFASTDHKDKYHRTQWLMSLNREYVYRPANPSRWFDLDETTRLKYMMHNLGDVAVPIGHSPANSYGPAAASGQTKELAFEIFQADMGSYGSPSAPGSWYTGTIANCVSQFYANCMANTAYFANNVSPSGLFSVSPWSNANTAAHEGWRISQMLAKAVLTDYYLAKRSAADAGPDITVGPGETVIFSAADLRDPDNIIWDGSGNGTYGYSSSWTGISQVKWDLDGDGIYETTGVEASRTYAQLAGLIGSNASELFGIEVTDDEGNISYDTALLTTVPEPMTLGIMVAGGVALLRRRK